MSTRENICLELKLQDSSISSRTMVFLLLVTKKRGAEKVQSSRSIRFPESYKKYLMLALFFNRHFSKLSHKLANYQNIKIFLSHIFTPQKTFYINKINTL